MNHVDRGILLQQQIIVVTIIIVTMTIYMGVLPACTSVYYVSAAWYSPEPEKDVRASVAEAADCCEGYVDDGKQTLVLQKSSQYC